MLNMFPYIGNSNPNWRTHIFQRGGSTTNQPMSWTSNLGWLWHWVNPTDFNRSSSRSSRAVQSNCDLKPSRFSPWFCGIHRFDKICLFHPFLSPSYRVFTRFNQHSCWFVSSCFITFLVQSQFYWFNPVNCWYFSLPFLHKMNHANPTINPLLGWMHICVG